MVAPIILSISIFVICAVIIFRESCEIVIYPVSKLLIFHPHLKEVAIEYNHTHTHLLHQTKRKQSVHFVHSYLYQ